MPRVLVDLEKPDLAAKIARRFALLERIADELTYGPGHLLDAQEVNYNIDDIRRVTEAYFLLSESYKIARLGHSDFEVKRTRNPKKAGLTALAIFALNPFLLLNPDAAPLKTVSKLANLQFATDFAATVLDRPIRLTGAMQLRLFRFLNAQSLQSLAEYREDQRQGRFVTRYMIDIDADLTAIEMMILFFELHGYGGSDQADD